jgi:hypothetical protein
MAHFGIAPSIVALVWQMIWDADRTDPEFLAEAEPEYLLYGLLFLKLYESADVTASLASTNTNSAISERKYRTWSQRMVEEIACLAFDVVSN